MPINTPSEFDYADYLRRKQTRRMELEDRVEDALFNLGFGVCCVLAGVCLALFVGTVREKGIFGTDYTDYLRVLIAPWWPDGNKWDDIFVVLYLVLGFIGAAPAGMVVYWLTFSFAGACDSGRRSLEALSPAFFLALVTVGVLITLPWWHQPATPGLTVDLHGMSSPWSFWSWLCYSATWWLPGIFVLLTALRVCTGLRLFPRSRWERRIWS